VGVQVCCRAHGRCHLYAFLEHGSIDMGGQTGSGNLCGVAVYPTTDRFIKKRKTT